MGWTAADAAKWIANNLGPTLRSGDPSSKDVKIIMMDDNKAVLPTWAREVRLITQYYTLCLTITGNSARNLICCKIKLVERFSFNEINLSVPSIENQSAVTEINISQDDRFICKNAKRTELNTVSPL
jgi:hypothetical protein